MLVKLLKHDIRAICKTTFPMLLSMGIVSVVCCAIRFFTWELAQEQQIIGTITIMPIYIIGIIAIAVMAVLCAILPYKRYYESVFTDEGYLTMVIPVESERIVMAKLIGCAVCALMAYAVGFVTLFITVELPSMFYEPDYPVDGVQLNVLLSVLNVLNVFIQLIKFNAHVVCAITLGSLLIRKHKILGSILFIFIINLFENVLTGVITVAIGLSLMEYPNVLELVSLIVGSIIYVSETIVFYLVTVYFIKNKLNLD